MIRLARRFGLLLFGVAWLLAWLAPYWRLLVTPPFALGRPAAFTVLTPIRLERENAAATLALDTAQAMAYYQGLEESLDFIALIRKAAYLSDEEKVQELLLLQRLPLTAEEAQMWLNLPEDRWAEVYRATLQVSARLLQYTYIPTDPEALYRLIEPWLPADTASDTTFLVVRLLSKYFGNVQGAARTGVYLPGDVLVYQGQEVTPQVYALLEALGLTSIDLPGLLARAALLLVWIAALLSYHYTHSKTWKELAFPALFLLVSVAYAQYGFLFYRVPSWVLFVLPIPLIGLPPLFLARDLTSGLLWTWSLALSLFLDKPGGLAFFLYYAILSFALLLPLHHFRGLREYFYTGFVLAVFSLLTSAFPAFATGWPLDRWFGMLPAFVLSAFLVSGIGLFVDYLAGSMTGQVTHLHLMDLARPDHPLLQELMRRAPGTYQHSLMVASLAEQAARAIGADDFLCRVGGLYHDVGKLYNPSVFVENQTPDTTNPLTRVDPWTAAHLIKEHVPKGLELAARYRLPKRIRDFIAEHHGTTVVFMPYKRAIEAMGGDASRVNIEDFAYPGPKPRSKETAILMLADISEARVRAANPDSVEEIRRLVRDSIDLRTREGELDNSGLSIAELRKIEDAFVHVLVGIYHHRIRYESEDNKAGQGPVRFIPAGSSKVASSVRK